MTCVRRCGNRCLFVPLSECARRVGPVFEVSNIGVVISLLQNGGPEMVDAGPRVSAIDESLILSWDRPLKGFRLHLR
jgi:hypothetical protein